MTWRWSIALRKGSSRTAAASNTLTTRTRASTVLSESGERNDVPFKAIRLAALSLIGCKARGAIQAWGGGIGIISRGLVQIYNAHVAITTAEIVPVQDEWYVATIYGGGIFVANAFTSILDSSIEACEVISTSRALDQTVGGGGVYATDASTRLKNVNVTSCAARLEVTPGALGSLYAGAGAVSGGVHMASGLGLFENGVLLSKSKVIGPRSGPSGVVASPLSLRYNQLGVYGVVGTLIWLLPTFSGRWLPSVYQCSEFREPCLKQQGRNCNVSGQPILSDPGCPRDPKYGLSMDGKYVSLGVSGAYDAETLPYLCNAGCYGNLTKPMKQNTGTCTGLCPAGNYCPTPGTVDPIICPSGSWCPEGSILPRVCDAGYFSNQTGNSKRDQCDPCPPGFYCQISSSYPSPCDAAFGTATATRAGRPPASGRAPRDTTVRPGRQTRTSGPVRPTRTGTRLVRVTSPTASLAL
mmetsp:Transcript_18764/g.55328  ORF Transcript_18764/g.55328 Transcript_18764/m.55328 type:complete len:468 (+) Transcript_18764:844-2247(+)